MLFGPLLMIAIGFDQSGISEDIAKEINALRAHGFIRLQGGRTNARRSK